MKLLLPLVLVLSAVPAWHVPAHGGDWCPSIHASCCDSPARWADRHDTRDARLAITTHDRHTTLVLTDRVVAVQLSDRTLRQVNRKLREEMEDDEDDDGVLARTIKTVVASTVGELLDHSVECRVRDLRDVSYRNGRLVFTTADGDRIFDGMEVDDDDVMQSFSERDARAFVRAFHEVKARRRS